MFEHRVHESNAKDLSPQYRGWIIGAFVDENATPLMHSHNVEIKWSQHPAGDKRESWAHDTSHTISILVRGRFVLTFREDETEREVVLQNEGDFARWNPGVEHTWRAEEESLIITVRWP